MMTKKFDYPDEATLRKMDRKLAKVKGSLSLPPDAGPVDRLKHDICRQFVEYCRVTNITQKELSKQIGISEARMSEILHYRHKRFTIDLLLKNLTKIKPNVKVKVG